MAQKSGKTETILQRLTRNVSEAKARVILYGVGVDRKRTWGDINKSYLCDVYPTFEDAHTMYLDDPQYIKAYRMAMEHVHNIKLIELYDLYYNKAKDDVQAFKAFLDFSDKLFKNDEGENELMKILQGVDIDE